MGYAGPQLESFVLTSSMTAVIDFSKKDKQHVFDEKDWAEYALKQMESLGDEKPTGRLLYIVSKVKAEQAVWDYRERIKVC